MKNKHQNESGQVWGIEELVEKINLSLGSSDAGKTDSRMAELMSPRNLRRLVSIGAIDQPERRGREAYYGPKHLEQALAARHLMSQGFSGSSIMALRSAASEPPAAATEPAAEPQSTGRALGFLNSIGKAPSEAKFPASMAENAWSARPAQAFAQGAAFEAQAGSPFKSVYEKAQRTKAETPAPTLRMEIELAAGLKAQCEPSFGASELDAKTKESILCRIEALWLEARKMNLDQQQRSK